MWEYFPPAIMAPKWTKEYHREHMKLLMRKKRQENPGYGKARVQKTTIAFCRRCRKEMNWRDAVKDPCGYFHCPECDSLLYTLLEQHQPRSPRKKPDDNGKTA